MPKLLQRPVAQFKIATLPADFSIGFGLARRLLESRLLFQYGTHRDRPIIILQETTGH